MKGGNVDLKNSHVVLSITMLYLSCLSIIEYCTIHSILLFMGTIFYSSILFSILFFYLSILINFQFINHHIVIIGECVFRGVHFRKVLRKGGIKDASTTLILAHKTPPYFTIRGE